MRKSQKTKAFVFEDVEEGLRFAVRRERNESGGLPFSAPAEQTQRAEVGAQKKI